MVAAVIRLFRWRKATDVPVVGELLKLSCFWFLIKGSLGETKPWCFTSGFLNLTGDSEVSHLTMQLHFPTRQNSLSSARCWAGEVQQRKFPAAWDTWRAPLCERDRAAFGSMGYPRALPWGRSSWSKSCPGVRAEQRSRLCRQLLWVQLPSVKCFEPPFCLCCVSDGASCVPRDTELWALLRFGSPRSVVSKTTCLVTSCTLRESWECSLKDGCTISFHFMFSKTPLLLVKSTCRVSLGVLGLLLCTSELAGALAFPLARPWAAQSACAAACSRRLLMAFRWNGCCSKCANARGMMCGREQETVLMRRLLRDKDFFFFVAGQKMNWREMRILTEFV